jgi:hypothetical protein
MANATGRSTARCSGKSFCPSTRAAIRAKRTELGTTTTQGTAANTSVAASATASQCALFADNACLSLAPVTVLRELFRGLEEALKSRGACDLVDRPR